MLELNPKNKSSFSYVKSIEFSKIAHYNQLNHFLTYIVLNICHLKLPGS